MASRPWRQVQDGDIAAYRAYRHKLAAITTAGDPPPHCFTAWFQARYHADPRDELLAADPLEPAAVARVWRPAAAQPAPAGGSGA